jgi:Na+/proline symporter
MKTRKIFYVYCGFFVIVWALLYLRSRYYLLPYSFVAFCIAWALYRLPTIKSQETLQSFFLYERKMPRNEFVGTLVTTNVGFFSSVAFSTVLIVTMGIGPAVILVVAWAAGLAWFAHFVPRLLPFFRQGSTVHEYIGKAHGKTAEQQRHLRFYSSVITFLLYLASVGAEIKFTSDVFSGPTRMTTAWLSLALCVAGVIYVSISGYRGVVSTDRVRFWAILAGVLAIYYFISHNWRAVPISFPSSYFSPWMLTIGPSPSQLLSLVLLLTLYQFCVMDMWERCIGIVNSDFTRGEANPDEALIKTMRHMIISSIIPFVILFGAWYGVGLLALGQKWCSDPSQIILQFVVRLQAHASTGLAGSLVLTMVVLCFSAAALSTIDGFIIAAVQTIIFDWLPSFRKEHKQVDQLSAEESRNTLRLARLLVLIVGALAVGIAYTSFGIMSFWVGMYSLMLSFFPAIFLSLVSEESDETRPPASQVAASIVCGAFAALFTAVLGTFFLTQYPLLVALPPFLAAGIAFMVLLPGRPKKVKICFFVAVFTLGLVLMLLSLRVGGSPPTP